MAAAAAPLSTVITTPHRAFATPELQQRANALLREYTFDLRDSVSAPKLTGKFYLDLPISVVVQALAAHVGKPAENIRLFAKRSIGERCV